MLSLAPLFRLLLPAAAAAAVAATEEEADDDEEDESRLACDDERRWKSFFGCASASFLSLRRPPWPYKALASLFTVCGVFFAVCLVENFRVLFEPFHQHVATEGKNVWSATCGVVRRVRG